MLPIFTKITEALGGNIITSLTSVVDKFINTKEEKAQALMQMQTEVNRHIEAMKLQANSELEQQVKNMADARNREIQVVTSEHTPLFVKLIPSILALIVIVGGGFLFVYAPEDRTAIIGIIIIVLTYYFGSTLGSKRKQDFIEQMTKK